MEANRREFLKGTAWMGAAALAAGCTGPGFGFGEGGTMCGYAAPALKHIRVGVVGLGNRGPGAVHRLAMIPGVTVTALCDYRAEKVAKQQQWLKDNAKPPAREFVGEEGYKALCDSNVVDVVYVATDWAHHAEVGLRALRSGKHAFIEVPSAMTVDECWELVETSEATKLHCMQLENACYGEEEMLGLNIVRLGLLGELVHGEGGYIHDLRRHCYNEPDKGGYWNDWRLRWNMEHKGNQYTTHGLGPICQYMDINRGDRFDYLVSLESNQANFEYWGRRFAPNAWKKDAKVEMGDMNTTLIKTKRGRSILLQHDVSSPRPYTRHNLVSGTKGTFYGMPWRLYEEGKTSMQVFLDDPSGKGSAVHKFMDEKARAEFREKYRHPLWKTVGEIAKVVGGHGGMDFIMDLRWAYCLQNALPLDMDVYDLASWCSIAELSEKSVRSGSKPQDVPDFTRGKWRTAKPLGIVDVDLKKMRFLSVTKDKSALTA